MAHLSDYCFLWSQPVCQPMNGQYIRVVTPKNNFQNPLGNKIGSNATIELTSNCMTLSNSN